MTDYLSALFSTLSPIEYYLHSNLSRLECAATPVHTKTTTYCFTKQYLGVIEHRPHIFCSWGIRPGIRMQVGLGLVMHPLKARDSCIADKTGPELGLFRGCAVCLGMCVCACVCVCE